MAKKCEKKIDLQGSIGGQKDYCGKTAPHVDTNGRNLCPVHYKAWLKKVAKPLNTK